MYQQGLTVKRIADLCGAVKGTVDRHIRIQREKHPELQTAHEANRPAKKPLPASPISLASLAAVEAYQRQHGAYPTLQNPDKEIRRLAGWLSNQRARHRAGRLTSEKLERLAALPDWDMPQRIKADAERWERIIGTSAVSHPARSLAQTQEFPLGD